MLSLPCGDSNIHHVCCLSTSVCAAGKALFGIRFDCRDNGASVYAMLTYTLQLSKQSIPASLGSCVTRSTCHGGRANMRVIESSELHRRRGSSGVTERDAHVVCGLISILFCADRPS